MKEQNVPTEEEKQEFRDWVAGLDWGDPGHGVISVDECYADVFMEAHSNPGVRLTRLSDAERDEYGYDPDLVWIFWSSE